MRYLINNGLVIWAIFCGILVINGIFQLFKLARRGAKAMNAPHQKAPATTAAQVALVQRVRAQPTEKHAPRKRGRPPKDDGSITLTQFADRIKK